MPFTQHRLKTGGMYPPSTIVPDSRMIDNLRSPGTLYCFEIVSVIHENLDHGLTILVVVDKLGARIRIGLATG